MSPCNRRCRTVTTARTRVGNSGTGDGGTGCSTASTLSPSSSPLGSIGEDDSTWVSRFRACVPRGCAAISDSWVNKFVETELCSLLFVVACVTMESCKAGPSSTESYEPLPSCSKVGLPTASVCACITAMSCPPGMVRCFAASWDDAISDTMAKYDRNCEFGLNMPGRRAAGEAFIMSVAVELSRGVSSASAAAATACAFGRASP